MQDQIYLKLKLSSIPDGVNGQENVKDEIKFLVKAAEIPASNLGNIPVPFRGRVLPIAGDRTFDPWTVTIINDTNFNIRDAMETWSNLLMISNISRYNPSRRSYQRKQMLQLSTG